eukprot:8044836-Pyramimonas_sp.AAC.1
MSGSILAATLEGAQTARSSIFAKTWMPSPRAYANNFENKAKDTPYSTSQNGTPTPRSKQSRRSRSPPWTWNEIDRRTLSSSEFYGIQAKDNLSIEAISNSPDAQTNAGGYVRGPRQRGFMDQKGPDHSI